MYPPHHYGGYELQCRDIVTRFRARGHDCTVLTSDTRVAGVHADDDGGVRRDLRIYWDEHRVERATVGRRWRIEGHNQRTLRAVLEEVRPDVVSVWHMGAMSLGLIGAVRRAGIPLVFVVCDDWLCYAGQMDGWTSMFANRPRAARYLRPVIERLGLPVGTGDIGADGPFCFVSRRTLETAARNSPWRYPVATVVYSGVDSSVFTPAAARRGPWGWRLLCAGRIEPRKGIDTAIRALPLLPSARLAVVGRGDDEVLSGLRSLAARLGVDDRVEWAVTDRAGLAARYRDADAVVFPVTWEEPFGLVPVEAMACGTPVVGTGTGGSGEFLVDGVNYLRFPPDDPPALAAALTTLAGSPALCDRLVEAGRRTAAELSIDRLADVLEAWHVGAAAGFPSGYPEDRPSIASILAPG